MDQLKQNQKYVFLGAGILAFILIAFCPAVDVMGKATMNGFKFVFDATGAGISRFFMLLFLLLPLAGAVLSAVVPQNKWANNLLFIFGGAVVIGLLTLICLPTGCSFAVGSWLGIILCLAAGVLAYMFNQPVKK